MIVKSIITIDNVNSWLNWLWTRLTWLYIKLLPLYKLTRELNLNEKQLIQLKNWVNCLTVIMLNLNKNINYPRLTVYWFQLNHENFESSMEFM